MADSPIAMATSGSTHRHVVLRQYIYFTVALLALSIALGSLSRSQPGGGSWLANSYWVLYVVMLLPIIALGAMVVMVVFLVLTWRETSDALGSGIAGRAKQRKKSRRMLRLIVYISTWAVALTALWYKCGGIPCRQAPMRPSEIEQIVTANQSVATDPAARALVAFLNVSGSISSIVQSEWFIYAFFGLIVVSSAVFLRSVKVAVDDFRTEAAEEIHSAHTQGLIAVKDAIQIVQEPTQGGPRERILLCYKRMIKAALEMGARVTVDQTARELESTLKRTFMLNGDGIGALTDLFEEARYSLHPMTQADSQEACSTLVKIETELNVNS